MAALGLERNGRAHGVEEVPLVDAGEHEAAPVHGLRPLGGGANAHGREGVAD